MEYRIIIVAFSILLSACGGQSNEENQSSSSVRTQLSEDDLLSSSQSSSKESAASSNSSEFSSSVGSSSSSASSQPSESSASSISSVVTSSSSSISSIVTSSSSSVSSVVTSSSSSEGSSQSSAESEASSSLSSEASSQSSSSSNTGGSSQSSSAVSLSVSIVDENGDVGHVGDLLRAQVTGSTNVNYRWYKNGLPINAEFGASYKLTYRDIPATISVRVFPQGGGESAEAVFKTGGHYFYIDPLEGDDANDGSYDFPWKSFQHLLDEQKIVSQQWESLPPDENTALIEKNIGATVRAGDVIVLRNGFYGALTIVRYYNKAPIYVVAEQGHTPRFTEVEIRSSSNWVVRGVHVEPEGDGENSRLMMVKNHSWTGPSEKVGLIDNRIQSIDNASLWGLEQWRTLARSGVTVEGEYHHIEGNQLHNVAFGIDVSAKYSNILNNEIINFAGDGIRSIGSDYTVFEGNTIKYAHDLKQGNHDDGFQNFGGPTYGVTFRGNTIVHFDDPNQPLRGPLQGFGAFDSAVVGWVIENNRIITDHYHGITVQGARDTVIRGNIVSDPDGAESVGPAAIRVRYAKDSIGGLPSTNVTVECNVAPFVVIESGQDTVTEQYNTLTNSGQPDWDSRCSVVGPP